MMSTFAFAQDVDVNNGGDATITINNASKGETYSIYKIFNATITDTKDSVSDLMLPCNSSDSSD